MANTILKYRSGDQRMEKEMCIPSNHTIPTSLTMICIYRRINLLWDAEWKIYRQSFVHKNVMRQRMY